MNNNSTLKTHARKLRLGGLAGTLETPLQEATANRLPRAEFLGPLLQDELNVREGRTISRRVKAAHFRDAPGLEGFDFSFKPAISRDLVCQGANRLFIVEGCHVLLVGPPGVGKSHLAQALGHEAIRHGHTVYLPFHLRPHAQSPGRRPFPRKAKTGATGGV